MRISIFDNQHEAVKELPEERQGAFWMAFFAYVFDNVEPEFSEPIERMAWNLVLPYIEKSKTAAQNGEKGGRKPNQKTKTKTKTETKQKTKTETKTGNQIEKPPLSELELEHELEQDGFPPPLKGEGTTSRHGAGAGAGGPAPRPVPAIDWAFDDPDRMPSVSKHDAAVAQIEASRAAHDEMAANAVECPQAVLDAIRERSAS